MVRRRFVKCRKFAGSVLFPVAGQEVTLESPAAGILLQVILQILGSCNSTDNPGPDGPDG